MQQRALRQRTARHLPELHGPRTKCCVDLGRTFLEGASSRPRRKTNCSGVGVPTDNLSQALDDWERHVGGMSDDRSQIKPSADGRHPLTDPDFISGLSNASVQAFICRSGFDRVAEPAFLL